MTIDIIGLEQVLAYIRSTNKSKFTILRAGQNGSNIPVFECFDNSTTENAMRAFEQWAKVMNNNNVYKIVLFDLLDDDEGTQKKTRAKAGKMEAFFALTDPSTSFGKGSNADAPTQTLAEIRKQVAAEMEAEKREDTLLAQIKELTLKVEAMQALDEEEEEEEEEEDLLGALKDPKTMMGLSQLFTMLRGGQPPVVNGTTEPAGTPADQAKAQSEKTQRLNSAVKRLFAVDKNLIEDLELLANLAEQKPETFNQMIGMLRMGI